MTTPLDLIPAPVRDILVAHAHITGTLTLSLASKDSAHAGSVRIGREGAQANAQWRVHRSEPNRNDLMGSSMYGDTVQSALRGSLVFIRAEYLRTAEWYRGEAKRVRGSERKQQRLEWAAKAEADAATIEKVLEQVTAAWSESGAGA